MAVKRKKAADLVWFAVHELDDSRDFRAGLLEASAGHNRNRGTARRALVDGDAEVETRSAWLRDQTALSRAGLKRLLKGWHDSAALAAVDAWPLGKYDAVKHPDAIVRVDEVVIELARRFPDVHQLLQVECERADLPRLLYARLPRGTRIEAARRAVTG